MQKESTVLKCRVQCDLVKLPALVGSAHSTAHREGGFRNRNALQLMPSEASLLGL